MNDRSSYGDRTVAELTGDPRILAIVAARGINHCCGAHLPLREAAAAAGVPLDEVLAEIAAVAAPPSLDVRGLEPPLPMVRVLERIETLAAGDTLEVLLERHPRFLYPQLEARGLSHETDEPAPGVVRVRIRR
jgi:uncharacterized protein (DUF2249 family)